VCFRYCGEMLAGLEQQREGLCAEIFCVLLYNIVLILACVMR
jgi:hypothetical protein